MSSRKLDLALTLGIVLEVVEILRRLPGWLLLALATIAMYAVLLVCLHPWWTVAAVVPIALRFALKAAR